MTKLEYVTVPKGSRATECRGKDCRAVIYWIERPSRNRKTPDKVVKVPVDCAADDQCYAPSLTADGLGLNHFQNCANAGRF